MPDSLVWGWTSEHPDFSFLQSLFLLLKLSFTSKGGTRELGGSGQNICATPYWLIVTLILTGQALLGWGGFHCTDWLGAITYFPHGSGKICDRKKCRGNTPACFWTTCHLGRVDFSWGTTSNGMVLGLCRHLQRGSDEDTRPSLT